MNYLSVTECSQDVLENALMFLFVEEIEGERNYHCDRFVLTHPDCIVLLRRHNPDGQTALSSVFLCKIVFPTHKAHRSRGRTVTIELTDKQLLYSLILSFGRQRQLQCE